MYQSNFEIRVGLFALFALIILVYGWSWLKSFSLFNQPQRFTVRFADVAGLSNNAMINVQGVRVGAVEYIAFVEAANEGKMVDVHLKVTNETIRIPKGATITIQTLGLVGAKYVECTLPRDIPPESWVPLNESDTVRGVDPVRVELVLNDVATKVADVVSGIDTESANKAINNLSSASEKLNKNMDRMASASESVKVATESITVTSEKFGHTADNATIATERASAFFKTGSETMEDISDLTGEFKTTGKRVNKLLDNPNFSGDLKETLNQAKQTAQVVQTVMRDFETTLQDKPLRDDILAILTRLQGSTENIKHSIEIVNKVSNDEGLRSDLKDIVRTANEALKSANNILADPQIKQNLQDTMNRVKSAACNVDVAAKQIRQVLGKRAPLLQLLFGRPGKLEEAPSATPVLPAPAPGK